MKIGEIFKMVKQSKLLLFIQIITVFNPKRQLQQKEKFKLDFQLQQQHNNMNFQMVQKKFVLLKMMVEAALQQMFIIYKKEKNCQLEFDRFDTNL